MCLTQDEFLVSKLMLKFFYSKQIQSTLGTSSIYGEQTFVKIHLEPHELHFCFYLRYNLKHFEKFINLIHEGTNRGLKYNATHVGPNTNIKKHWP